MPTPENQPSLKGSSLNWGPLSSPKQNGTLIKESPKRGPNLENHLESLGHLEAL